MKPLEQTRIGKEGNCFAACLGSILETGIPEFGVTSAPDYWDKVDAWLAARGLRYEQVPIDPSTPPVGFHTVEGVSPRGGMHAVVGLNGEQVHDPHPAWDDPRRGLAKPMHYGLLLPAKRRANDASPFRVVWTPEKVRQTQEIVQNYRETARMIERDVPLTNERKAEAAEYRRRADEWERTLPKGAERRGASDAGVGWRPTSTGDWITEDGRWRVRTIRLMSKMYWIYHNGSRYTPTGKYDDAVNFPTLQEAKRFVESKYAKAKDHADMLALRRNTRQQGGPFRVQLTEPSGKEHTESVHALIRAYDAVEPIPPFKPGDKIRLANKKTSIVRTIKLARNLLDEPEWHVLTNSGDVVTIKIDGSKEK